MEHIETLLDDCYKNYENFKVVHNPVNNKLCYIYCSSNALYNKGDYQDFENKIIRNDRYEWQNLHPAVLPALEIYIRDIWISWYVKGVNNKLNNYDSLISFLKELTQGFLVRCIGASSGGFVGTLLAMALDAECISFSGQFSLLHHSNHLVTNKYLREYAADKGNHSFETYMELEKTKAKIVYMVPVMSEQDCEQLRFVENLNNITVIKIKSNKHGVAIYPFAVSEFISHSIEEYRSLSIHGVYNKLLFSILQGGGKNFFIYCIKKIKRLYAYAKNYRKNITAH